jgi:hypothetical protein
VAEEMGAGNKNGMIDPGSILCFTADGTPVLGISTAKPRLLPGMNVAPPQSPPNADAVPIESNPSYFDSSSYQEYLHRQCLAKRQPCGETTLSYKEAQRRVVGSEFGEFGLKTI